MKDIKCVLDASVTMSWAFEDEKNTYSNAVLAYARNHTVFVPSVWGGEVSHILVKAERNKRISIKDLDSFIEELSELEYEIESTTYARAFTSILELAYQERLSFNDAAYLELALVKDLPIATLDKAMVRAARSLNVSLFLEEDSWHDYSPQDLVAYLKTDYSTSEVGAEPVGV